MTVTAYIPVVAISSILPKGMFEACVAQIYPYVDSIIISEGATQRLVKYGLENRRPFADAFGASLDNTREIIEGLPDPQRKIKKVFCERPWINKVDMFNIVQKKVETDYLWLIDSDEFYLEDSLPVVCNLIQSEAPDLGVFKVFQFYGDFHHVVSSDTDHKWPNKDLWHRIFRVTGGGVWTSHHPPTFLRSDKEESVDLKTYNFTKERGVRIFHYSQVIRPQAFFKSIYFRRPEYKKYWMTWGNIQNSALLFNGCHTENFQGKHPQIIQEVMNRHVKTTF